MSVKICTHINNSLHLAQKYAGKFRPWTLSVPRSEQFSWIFPSFSWGIFGQVTCLDQSHTSEKV